MGLRLDDPPPPLAFLALSPVPFSILSLPSPYLPSRPLAAIGTVLGSFIWTCKAFLNMAREVSSPEEVSRGWSREQLVAMHVGLFAHLDGRLRKIGFGERRTGG